MASMGVQNLAFEPKHREKDTWLFIYAWKVYNGTLSMIILLRLMAPDLTLFQSQCVFVIVVLMVLRA